MNSPTPKHSFPLLRSALRGTGVLVALLAAAPSAHAGDWKFSATPYAWATDVGMKADLNGRQVVDETIPVSDLMDMLDTIFQGRFDVQYRTVGLAMDVFDVTMSDRVDGLALPQGAGTATLSPDVRMTIFDLAATYTPPMRGRSVSALGGMRLVYERADVDANFALTAGPTVTDRYSTHETLVDALVGVRVVQPLSPHWGLQGQADFSSGGTEYTWSTAPSVFYVFDAARHYALSAGYRHMHIAFKEHDGLESDMTLSGALVGFRFSY